MAAGLRAGGHGGTWSTAGRLRVALRRAAARLDGCAPLSCLSHIFWTSQSWKVVAARRAVSQFVGKCPCKCPTPQGCPVGCCLRSHRPERRVLRMSVCDVVRRLRRRRVQLCMGCLPLGVRRRHRAREAHRLPGDRRFTSCLLCLVPSVSRYLCASFLRLHRWADGSARRFDWHCVPEEAPPSLRARVRTPGTSWKWGSPGTTYGYHRAPQCDSSLNPRPPTPPCST